MNRHLTIVELDARLFDTPASAAGFVERAVARSLQSEAVGIELTHADLPHVLYRLRRGGSEA